tara:strand:+ start:708 stop:1406 length:699 start_codon:yes stop_codon:yes gene_type:complete
MKILTIGNAKIVKGERLGFMTRGIHFAPATLSGHNVCAWASQGCAMACLNTSGRGRMQSIQNSRIAKTRAFFADKEGFLCKLVKEIESAVKSAERKGLRPCFRLNLTSDLPWENIRCHDGQNVFEKFPQVQFYDYTKGFKRMERYLNGKMPKNYHLTFSRSESNDKHARLVLEMGGNVAVVFRNQLPETWNGVEVINGDESDLRFLDKQGVVVGLVEKGDAKKDESGFVVNP